MEYLLGLGSLVLAIVGFSVTYNISKRTDRLIEEENRRTDELIKTEDARAKELIREMNEMAEEGRRETQQMIDEGRKETRELLVRMDERTAKIAEMIERISIHSSAFVREKQREYKKET